MNDNVKDAGIRSAAIHGEIRRYFLPVSKSYLHRLTFYLLYCAFLIIPATAKFLGQFRTRAGMLIKAATANGDIKITQLPFNKDVLEDVKAQVSRAKECLEAKRML